MSLLLVLLLLLAAVVSPRPLAQTSQPTAVQQDAGLRADFNQDGFADLAAGVAFEDVGSLGQAGVVTVLYGTANGTSGTGSQLFAQVAGATEAGDLFGSALASGDFNQDGFADLAASAPGEDVGSTPDAGAVSVLFGSAAGLTVTGGRLFTQAGGAIEREDRVGTALASADFNHDGFADLAAGAPGEAVGTIRGAGAVSVLYGSAAGLTTAGGRLFTQVGSASDSFDFFGSALASGDFNHDGFADLAASAAGRSEFAGAVTVLYGTAGGVTTTGGRLFTQDSPGVPGAAEPYDYFGFSLTAGGLGTSPAAASTTGTSPTRRPTASSG